MRYFYRLCLSLVTASALLVPGASYANDFFALGDLAGGPFLSTAFAVTDDGSRVVGQSLEENNSLRAFTWSLSDQQITPLAVSLNGSVPQVANAISADGQIIAGRASSDESNGQAFISSISQGTTTIGQLVPGAFGSVANDLSAAGDVVVGNSVSEDIGVEAFRWTSGGGLVGLGGLSAESQSSSAQAVSADGTVIVGLSDTSEGTFAYRWTESGGMTSIGDLPGRRNNSLAWNVSDDGSVVVGTAHSDIPQEAFRWSEASGMIGLGTLPDATLRSEAFATNGDGSIIVGVSGMLGNESAFVWDEKHGMRDLQRVLVQSYGLEEELEGWRLQWVTDISADGRHLVGKGINPMGSFEGWLLRLNNPINIPEPTGILLICCLIVALLASQRMKQTA